MKRFLLIGALALTGCDVAGAAVGHVILSGVPLLLSHATSTAEAKERPLPLPPRPPAEPKKNPKSGRTYT